MGKTRKLLGFLLVCVLVFSAHAFNIKRYDTAHPYTDGNRSKVFIPIVFENRTEAKLKVIPEKLVSYETVAKRMQGKNDVEIALKIDAYVDQAITLINTTKPGNLITTWLNKQGNTVDIIKLKMAMLRVRGFNPRPLIGLNNGELVNFYEVKLGKYDRYYIRLGHANATSMTILGRNTWN